MPEQAASVPGPPICLYGSKWQMAPWIIANLPRHRCYVEVFAGSAVVLLRKPRVPVEYLNDRDSDLVTFFEVARDRPEGLARFLAHSPLSQAVIESDRPDDPLVRAAWVFTRSWGRYLGPPRSATFAVSAFRSPARAYERACERIAAVSERLRGVVITCLDFRELLPRLDKEGVCFYCDPPYIGEERSYPVCFEREDHAALAGSIRALRHATAAVSYAEQPLIHQLYSDATIFRRQVRSQIGSAKQTRTELLVVTRPRSTRSPCAEVEGGEP